MTNDEFKKLGPVRQQQVVQLWVAQAAQLYAAKNKLAVKRQDPLIPTDQGSWQEMLEYVQNHPRP